MKENFKKYLVEIIGTFFLVLTVACCSFSGNPFGAAAIASVLMVMVYAGGHISGGHYNPAVSLAACIRGALSYRELVPYWAAQIVGALIAFSVFYALVGQMEIFHPFNFAILPLFIAEIVFTFALCYVVLLTATAKQIQGNSYYGLAIGFTVFAGAIAVGGRFCAGAFNPAVAMNLGLMNMTSWTVVLATIAANLIGGALAAYVFKYVSADE